MKREFKPGDIVYYGYDDSFKGEFMGVEQDSIIIKPLNHHCFATFSADECEAFGLSRKYEGCILFNNNYINYNSLKLCDEPRYLSDWHVYEDEKPPFNEDVFAFNDKWKSERETKGIRIGYEDKDEGFIMAVRMAERPGYYPVNCSGIYNGAKVYAEDFPTHWKEITF